VQDFAHEIVTEWKGWLTGSLPMASIAVTSLVNPDWIHFPLWTWALLIFVGGLLFAMFRVYRELRQQRDALQQNLDGIGIVGPFMLVPFSGHSDVFRKVSQKGVEQ
jgi:type II secretory pathway component PulF